MLTGFWFNKEFTLVKVISNRTFVEAAAVPVVQYNNSDVELCYKGLFWGKKRKMQPLSKNKNLMLMLMFKYGVKRGLPVALAFPLLPGLQVYQ